MLDLDFPQHGDGAEFVRVRSRVLVRANPDNAGKNSRGEKFGRVVRIYSILHGNTELHISSNKWWAEFKDFEIKDFEILKFWNLRFWNFEIWDFEIKDFSNFIYVYIKIHVHHCVNYQCWWNDVNSFQDVASFYVDNQKIVDSLYYFWADYRLKKLN